MRTDTQRLDWILAALDSGNEEPFERLQAAYTLELRGRAAMDAAMGAKVVEPGEPMPALTAIDLATAELGRIRDIKGFSEERDDLYTSGELGDAAVKYIAPGDSGWVTNVQGDLQPCGWPWQYPEDEGYHEYKPSPDDRKKELTKGIALALCELDRLIRAERNTEIEKHLNSPEHRAYIDSLCDPERPVTVGIDLASSPRGFKVGDRVRCAQSGYVGLPDPILGTIVSREPEGAIVRVDGYVGGSLYWGLAELEHVDD